VTYRERIYENYASNFQDLSPVFDATLSHRWGRAYDYYLRGWLPKAKDAARLLRSHHRARRHRASAQARGATLS
jgi:hypothetical protein